MQCVLRVICFWGMLGSIFLPGASADPVPLNPPAEAAPLSPEHLPHEFDFQIDAPQAILYDMLTDTILFEKEADQIMVPSSMTKALLIYILFEKLSREELKLSDMFTVSERAWRMGGSKMFVPLGGQVSFENLLQGIIVQSGNDACLVITEALAGSEEAFVILMNKKAKDLGGTKTHFLNSTGWPERGHTSTPRDILLFGVRTIQDFPELYDKYYPQKEFTYNGIRQTNRNPLLYSKNGNGNGTIGDGLKTGHTDEGGFGLLGSGKREDRRLVFVVNGLKNNKHRAETAERLLLYGLDRFEAVLLYPKGAIIKEEPLSAAPKTSVPLVAAAPILVTVRRGYADQVTTKFEKNPQAFRLPIQKGQVLGNLIVSSPGLPDKIFPLSAGESVEKPSFLLRMWATIKNFFLSFRG